MFTFFRISYIWNPATVTFLEWLLCSSMHLGPSLFFSWLDNSFLFSTEKYSFVATTSLFIRDIFHLQFYLDSLDKTVILQLFCFTQTLLGTWRFTPDHTHAQQTSQTQGVWDTYYVIQLLLRSGTFLNQIAIKSALLSDSGTSSVVRENGRPCSLFHSLRGQDSRQIQDWRRGRWNKADPSQKENSRMLMVLCS